MNGETKSNRMSAVCARCRADKPYSTAKTCGQCYREEQRGKSFGRGAELKLTARRLTREQRAVFKAITAGRKRSWQTDMDALLMISAATERGELAEELAFWTTSSENEPPHKTTSLGLMSVYAPGSIQ